MYDISNDKQSVSVKVSVKEITDSIIKVGKRCRQSGVNDVLISAIVKRKQLHLQKKVNELNTFLETKCAENNFIFLNHSNIMYNDICKDNLHLNYSGTCKVATNIIKYINLIESNST